MRITENRLRRIIRETLAEMETDWWRKITPLDVEDVLSALTKAPPSAWDGPTWNPEGVEVLFKELPEMKEPFGLLKAIKGWIQGIEFRTPGMKRALELIDGVAARVGVEIPPAISSLKMEVEELIDRAWAWDDEDGEANIVGRHIFDEAQVLGGARVTDNAMVTDKAQVSGNARVSDNAVVGVRAQVRDDAVVSEFAVVGDDAKVYGNAVVTGYARLEYRAQVGGNARIGGTAEIRGGTWDGSEGEITSGRWMAPGKRAKP